MSSTLQPVFPDRLMALATAITQWQRVLTGTTVTADEVGTRWRSIQTLEIEALLGPQAEVYFGEALPPPWLGVTTEIRRLLRLTTTELAFFQGARSPVKSHFHQQKLLTQAQQLASLVQGLVQLVQDFPQG